MRATRNYDDIETAQDVVACARGCRNFCRQSISGNTVLVGAIGDDDGGSKSGSAYIFQKNEGGVDNWGEIKKLTASDADADDMFSVGVSISGDSVVIGAFGDDDNGGSSGSAYVYQNVT